MLMTLQKITDAASVSVSTVSKAFSWSNEISEEKGSIYLKSPKKKGAMTNIANLNLQKK